MINDLLLLIGFSMCVAMCLLIPGIIKDLQKRLEQNKLFYKQKKQRQMQRFTAKGVAGFNTAYEAAVESLKTMGLGGESEPPIAILLIGTGRDIADTAGEKTKEVDCYFYIDATNEEISKDLLSLNSQPKTASTL